MGKSSAGPVVELIVYTDIKSPYAYLAKDHMYALEDETGVAAEWRHFTLDIPSYLGSAKVDDAGNVLESTRTEHQWKKVKYAYMDVRRRANLRGLTIKGTQKIWDSSMAGIALDWAQQSGQDVMRRFLDDAFERFWRRDLDIEDVTVLVECLTRAGADPDGFAGYVDNDGRAKHDQQRQEAWDHGVFGVPTFRVNDELFFGSEQIPLVRWRLGGSVGECPDLR